MDHREQLIAEIGEKLEAYKRDVIQAYEEHHYTCENPIACEVRAWQAYYRTRPYTPTLAAFWESQRG